MSYVQHETISESHRDPIAFPPTAKVSDVHSDTKQFGRSDSAYTDAPRKLITGLRFETAGSDSFGQLLAEPELDWLAD
jgi:hypothetical protein